MPCSTVNQPARIRLNSTVMNVHHEGTPDRAKEVVVTYSRGGKLYDVRARGCVMACWNMFIPYLEPDLPAKQKEALAYAVKGPIVYTSVGVKNWTAWQKLGIANINAPTMFHPSVALTEASTLGELQHPQSPSEPIALHLTKVPTVPGKPRQEQHRLGRAELLATSCETFERKIRDQLARSLGAGGFDPARDIVAITVNRWPHGYAYTYNSLYEPMEWVYTNSENRPNIIARQPHGLIASKAGNGALLARVGEIAVISTRFLRSPSWNCRRLQSADKRGFMQSEYLRLQKRRQQRCWPNYVLNYSRSKKRAFPPHYIRGSIRVSSPLVAFKTHSLNHPTAA
jgi:hypothetical protein